MRQATALLPRGAFPGAVLVAAVLLLVLTVGVPGINLATADYNPTLSTDKEDYYSNEIVTVTGTGFLPNTTYDIPIIRPNGSIVLGDGSFAPGWDSVTSDANGDFTYYYQLNGIPGTYTIETYVSPWGGPGSSDPLVATFTFTDADIHFSQCRNDSDNNDVADDCDWTTGGLNGSNSVYREGDGVPQRLFRRVDDPGTYTFVFEYDFSKGDAYAYDFLTTVDVTQSGALLNQCLDRPGFISLSQCNTMYGTNFQLAAIPSDPFDSVSLRETPASRYVRVGCTPACSVGTTVFFPDSPIGPNDGEAFEAHVPDSDPDCFKNCGTSVVTVAVTVTTTSSSTRVGMWYAGHLAQAADPPGSAVGWGVGCGSNITCGASAISGAPFHLRYICLEYNGGGCSSEGNRDNQMQIGAVLPPGLIQIVKDAVPDSAQDFSFTGSLGNFSLDDDSNGTLSNNQTFVDVTPGTYTVTEDMVSGWTLTSISCSDPDSGTTINTGTRTATIDLDSGENLICTFVNTQNAVAFSVNKDFSDNNAADVNVSLSCTSGTVSTVDGTASESDPADFNVVGYSGDPTCTAMESPVPAGYESTGTCQAALSAGSCTILNTLRTATLNVAKDFSDNNPADVTISVVCTSGTVNITDNTASESDTANITITGFNVGATCTATEGVPAGYTANQANCANVAITHNGTANCTITNTLNSGTVNVQKDFSDNNAATVTVSVNCGGNGTVNNVDTSASEADDANFTITGFTPPLTCSATEGTAPAGYTKDESACQNVGVPLGGSAACTIVNTLSSATLNVQKDFSDNSAASVTVSINCGGNGTINNVDTSASEADDANFTITGFTPPLTCSATEGAAPAGYTKDESDCQNVAIPLGGSETCVIVNTLNEDTFTVNKDFSDNNPASVTVSLSCASGTATPASAPASEASPAVFNVSAAVGDPNCTATESPVPTGYSSSGTCGATLSAGSCTITNTLNSATLNVQKDFSDNSAASVTVSINCGGNGTVNNVDTSASEADDANFTITGFTPPLTCSATEGAAPAGYTKDESACQNVGVPLGGSAACTIVNTLNTATVNVEKDFLPDNPADVAIQLNCSSGTVVVNDGTASEADDANFTVNGFNIGATCVVTETIPAGYESDVSDCNPVNLAPGGSTTCTVTNTLRTATLNVLKDFSDNNPADVTISVVCTSGTVNVTDNTASESDDASATITGFGVGATCTATEGVPAGYTANQANCANVAISHGNTASCTIVNTYIVTPSPTPTPVPPTPTPSPTPVPPTPTPSPTVAAATDTPGPTAPPATPTPSGPLPVGGIVELPVIGSGAPSESAGSSGLPLLALLGAVVITLSVSSTVAFVKVRRR